MRPTPPLPPPPPTSSDDPASDGLLARAWRRFRSWPLWAQITVVVVLAILVLGSAVPDVEEDQAQQVDSDVDQPAQPATETSVTTSTTAGPTTTEAPTRTTTSAAPTTTSRADVEAAALEQAFPRHRVALARALDQSGQVETVDVVKFDRVASRVVVEITSPWSSTDDQVEGAWRITRLIARVWSPEDGALVQDHYTPGFRLTYAGATYDCDADFMIRLASVQVAKPGWLAEC